MYQLHEGNMKILDHCNLLSVTAFSKRKGRLHDQTGCPGSSRKVQKSPNENAPFFQGANSLVIRVLNCSGLNPTWVLRH